MPERDSLFQFFREISRLESLARRQNLSAYDAAYLDLALRTKLVLATFDDPLRRAAIAEGIAVLG